MKNDLTCAVTRDLLPSYVEGLTAPETNDAVARHLAVCPDCAKLRDDLAAPEETAAETAKEVDYLRTVKRRSRLRAVLAVICAAAVILASVGVKLFFIGEPASGAGMMRSAVYDAESHTLRLEVHAVESAMAYKGWSTRLEGNAVYVTARKVAVSPFYASGSHEMGIPLDESVKSVYLGGELIWQEGMVLSAKTMELYNAKTLYAGEAPALGRIAKILDLQSVVGGYTMELKTSAPPFGWTLNFTGKAENLTKLLPYYGSQMLALVDNLEEVTWTVSGPSGRTGRTLTADAVNARLSTWTDAYNTAHGTEWTVRNSIKDYADSPASFQQLLSILTYRYETQRAGVDDTDLLK